MRRYGRGWHNESYRHYLASKRIKTAKKGKLKVTRDIPAKGRFYPVPVSKTVKSIKNNENGRLIKEVRFMDPMDNLQEGAFAQYVRRDRRINVFSQPKEEFKEKNKDELEEEIIEKVIPHELAHHKILYMDRITDDNVEIAEARAEALRNGDNYKDEKSIKKYLGETPI